MNLRSVLRDPQDIDPAGFAFVGNSYALRKETSRKTSRA
jgi:hypothetical protein